MTTPNTSPNANTNMDARKKKLGSGAFNKRLGSRAVAWVGALTLLVLLTAAALVSQIFVNGRLDLTRDRQFTLSKAALKTLDSLPDIVTARVVMSRDLPSQFQQIRTQAVDLLREFEARSDGKFAVVFEDPGEDPERKTAAVSLGIQEVQLQEQSREGMQTKRGFFGLALLYGDKKEVFPVVRNLETFEYELIVRLMRLTGGSKTVGVLEGTDANQFTLSLAGDQQPPTRGFVQNFGTLKGNMEQLYNVVPLHAAWAPIGDDVDLLLVASPTYLSEAEKFRVDQFVMSGRPVIFMTPGMNINLSAGITAAPANNGYEDLLAHYGMPVRKNIVLEPRQWEMVRFGTAMFPTPYPYWVVATYNTMNPANPITASLQTLSLPWTSGIDIDTAAQPGATIEPLVFSTEEAWEESGNLYLYPREMNQYVPENQQTFPLVALQTGIMTSLYAGMPAGVIPEGVSQGEVDSLIRESRGESRVLVIPNALFATDFYIGYTSAAGNYHFLLNALDYLALDADLIGVRSRQINEAPLDEDLVSTLKTPLIIANLALAPLVLLILGIVAGVRKRKKEALA